MLVREYQMSPEAVMGMPFKRFMAWQRFAFRQSVEARNRELADRAAEEA